MYHGPHGFTGGIDFAETALNPAVQINIGLVATGYANGSVARGGATRGYGRRSSMVRPQPQFDLRDTRRPAESHYKSSVSRVSHQRASSQVGCMVLLGSGSRGELIHLLLISRRGRRVAGIRGLRCTSFRVIRTPAGALLLTRRAQPRVDCQGRWHPRTWPHTPEATNMPEDLLEGVLEAKKTAVGDV
jgi:hypothetical protein